MKSESPDKCEDSSVQSSLVSIRNIRLSSVPDYINTNLSPKIQQMNGILKYTYKSIYAAVSLQQKEKVHKKCNQRRMQHSRDQSQLTHLKYISYA